MSNDNKRFNLDGDEQIEAPEEEKTIWEEEEQAPEVEEEYASSEKFEEDKINIVDFLQYPKNKRELTEYLEGTYKDLEKENIERLIARQEHQHDCELEGGTPYHKPGHIGPLMYQYLNMVGVESAFSSALQHTKSSLTKTVQGRVDEINTLLRGVGGFNRQIKSSFSRSAVVYLEQEDPRYKHRERVIFTVNISDFELKQSLDESGEHEITPDGRSQRRLVWDESVNTLSEIISNTGLKPKYVKNNKNHCTLTMRQYLLTEHEKLPDEYFEFTLEYVNGARLQELKSEYENKLKWFSDELDRWNFALNKRWLTKKKKDKIYGYISTLEKDKEFYIATTPSPDQMDTGVLFSIYVNTMKDYSVTKDKMQVIMTKFILALSNIAVDKTMDQQVNKAYQNGEAEHEEQIIKKTVVKVDKKAS